MSAANSNQTIAIVCSLCEYFAPTEFDLQIHFDYNHPQILDEANSIRQVKVTSPKIKVEQVAASKLFESPPKPTFDSKLSLKTSLGMDFKSASNPTENGIKLKVEYFSDHSFSATSWDCTRGFPMMKSPTSAVRTNSILFKELTKNLLCNYGLLR